MLCPALAAGEPGTPDDDRLFRGAERELAVSLPRVPAADIRIDGVLDEALWERAAVLTEFTQFDPVEGAGASERTEVRIFYTPQALYVGVHAYAAEPGRIRATLADRDKILRDDHVQVILDTFNDRRRAYAFFVNPLGIQQDGVYNEFAGGRGDQRANFNPDFHFDSRGRVTEQGYVVELRIPFKGLKFPSSDPQTWGINVIRHIAATGAEESWAPLSRDNPSRLAQSGTLEGISQLAPGRLFELNPVLTGKREGAVRQGEFAHGAFQPDFGANLRYGLTSTLTLDATYNPDFSQVEADAGQITTNERFAISYPEKRPFFLEGADVFSTPEQLVHTRSIVSPLAGARLTGKVGGFTLGYIGALDESPLSARGLLAPRPSRALFNIVRLQRDVGAGSTLGTLITDREAAGQYNRVVGVDGRLRFLQLYTWEFQLANSWTRSWRRDAAGSDTALVDGTPVAVSDWTRSGHLVQTALDRTGRNWGFRLQLKDLPEDFRAQSGFIRRTGVTDLFYAGRYTWFGSPGALLESWGPFVMGNRIFEGRDLWHGESPHEASNALRVNFSLRGNNRITLAYTNRYYLLDEGRYGGYLVADPQGATRTGAEAVAPLREMSDLDGFSLDLRSSYFKTVSLETNLGWEQTPIFAEGTPGAEWSARAEVQLRPTDALRVQANVRHARIYRELDGSLYSQATLPRLRLEYQLNRAVFVRAVGQYVVEEVDLLRAPDGAPYQFGGESFRIRGGRRQAAEQLQSNPLRYDLLFSYQPSPGTVLFLGYGREMQDEGAYRLSSLDPRSDGLFLKLSYLFRT